jgi:hypothetical protein
VGFALFVAGLVAGCATPAADGSATLARAGQAMGSNDLKSIRYSTEGTGYAFGKAFVPTGTWPKFTVHSQERSINYDTGSMREEITLSRAEPNGGGGYPLMGQGQIYRITGGVHSDAFLMVHLPAEKVLIEADAYTPLAPNATRTTSI